MLKPLQITTGATQPWQFTLRDETGTAVNLTGGAVKLTMRKRGVATNKVENQACTLTSATTGVVTYAPQAADVDTPGTFDIEIAYTDASGKVQRNYQLIPLEIREKLF